MTQEIDPQEVIKTPAAEPAEPTIEPAAPVTEEPTDASKETVDMDTLIAENEELQDKNRKLYARLKRLEKSDTEPESKPKAAKKEQPNALSREEVILFAKGLEEDEVEKCKKIADVEGISLLEAQKTPYFTAYQEQKKKAKELEKADLGPSRGVRATVKKTFDSANLSDDDHKNLFKELMK